MQPTSAFCHSAKALCVCLSKLYVCESYLELSVLQLDLMEGLETSESLSSSPPIRFGGSSPGLEARSVVTSPRGAGSALHFSSSEEGEYESVEVPPPVSPQYEELFEVMTRAVAKLNIRWPGQGAY